MAVRRSRKGWWWSLVLAERIAPLHGRATSISPNAWSIGFDVGHLLAHLALRNVLKARDCIIAGCASFVTLPFQPIAMKLSYPTVLLFMLGSACLPLMAQQPGDLDTGFGTNGTVITGFGPGWLDNHGGVAVQPDGRILLSGMSAATQHYIAMARHLPSGALDPSFGTGGKVLTWLSDTLSSVAENGRIALQPDGRIVVICNAFINAGFVGAVLRYLPDGTLDNTFNGDGILFDNSSAVTVYGSISIQPDGRLVVAGMQRASGGVGACLVARYMPDGSPDPSFGSNGRALLSVPGMSVDGVSAASLQPDGRILVAGRIINGTYMDHFMARFTTTGQPDSGFGTGGRVVTAFSPTDERSAGLALQPDGRILAGVTKTDQLVFNQIGVARFQSNGTIDATFGTSGFAAIATAFDAECGQLALLSDARLAVAAQLSGQIVIAMLRDNGVLDSEFSGDGIAQTTAGLYQRGGRLAAQADGKLLLAGNAAISGPPDEVDMVLHRMHTRLSIVGVDEHSGSIHRPRVSPNPFHAESFVEFTLDSPQQLLLRLFDATGREVLLLPQHGVFAAGAHRFPVTGADKLPAGIYHLVINGAQSSLSMKVTKQ